MIQLLRNNSTQMRYTLILSALFATLAIAGPMQLFPRDVCCCYSGDSHDEKDCVWHHLQYVHASDYGDADCENIDCAYIDEQDAGLTEGETDSP
ncbi:hypothetical protein AUEXF2481DRAFT_41912 [Aureobasidium subglaciale EXF-2481]|uniref:Extracellular membrane protein CFEM domain-containing protein n=1 Tax=Aureobasidium subglaciale (strain EXF-2481) TaxID=1043005 RepID=A0A074YHX4_AURSE|nr:uncharacterized protein AUEXF2481DRAFT_41912 [Aureobasidium subglaciale EXF-2481]KEQ93677.1 hypothetical protein AUEXF2481DRAFT_41912 [Aureobasidium subglaciale EXF-2481]